MQSHFLAPSLLACDFARLGEEAQNVLNAGADMLHFDVMDNHYVPNLTMGPDFCQALRNYGITAPIDVHLMTSPVDRLITAFAKAGASSISIHPEATQHIDRSLQLIRDQGCLAGLAFNPATPLDYANYVIDKLDRLLIMTVNPGFGGQKFIPAMLDKIKDADALRRKKQSKLHIQVDGGVNMDNLAKIAKAGADIFVAGSAIFEQNDYAATIKEMRQQLAMVRS